MFINTVAVFIYEYDAYGQYLKFVLENPKFEIFLVLSIVKTYLIPKNFAKYSRDHSC